MIAPESPLASGLKPLDVIYSVNGHGVISADEAVLALRSHGAPPGLVVGYDRVVKGMIERRSVQVQ
jgi:S1-C subfamily serine protease